jgi:hypothetical protein
MTESEIERRTFTIPTSDLELLQQIRKRYLKAGEDVNKSEIVRAGIHVLSKMSDQDLIKNISSIPKYTVGRQKVRK